MVWTVALALTLGFIAAWADPARAVPRNPRFENVSVEQGLPQESVMAILQDRRGFMWFGTQAGLGRYDGHRFVVFRNDPADAGSLRDNWVGALHEDRAGRLWVGTRSGLQRFDDAREKFVTLAPAPTTPGARTGEVRALLGDIDPAGDFFWAATENGLLRIDATTGTVRAWNHDAARPESLASDSLAALATDEDGRLWVGTARGLDRWAPDTDRFEHFRLDESATPDANHNDVQVLFATQSSLWIGTLAGLEVWDRDVEPMRRRRLGAAEGIPPGEIQSITRDRDGNVWVGTRRVGLYRWDADAQRMLAYRHLPQDPNSLGADEVIAIHPDRGGVLWIGTWNSGVSRLDLSSGGFERYVTVAGDPHTISEPRVYGLSADGSGGIWIATVGGGLNHLIPETGVDRVYRHDAADPSSLNDDRVYAAAVAADGRVWVGTSSGASSLDPKSGRFTALPATTPDTALSHVRKILVDPDGTVWIGTDGGLRRHDPRSGTTTVFAHDAARPEGLSQGRILAILRDRKGVLWIGTDSGLDRYDAATETFVHHRHVAGDAATLSHDRVSDLFEDRSGRLWIGTSGGLNVMTGTATGTPSFRAYTRQDGLASDAIGAMLDDAAGRIWFSSTAGISRLDPATGQVRNYHARDGLITGSFYVGSRYAAPDGTMYFGGIKGMAAFRPESIRDNTTPPAVTITALKVLNRPVRGAERPDGVEFEGALQSARALRLGHQISVFSLEFAALHFADPSRNRFAHQLVGFDRDWVETDASDSTATYTNLAPGDYVFRVKAANKDGAWNETGATLAITILPPWWATWWFRTAAIAFVVGTALALYRYRISGLKHQGERLQQEVKLRTAEIERQKEQVEGGRRDLAVLGEIGREVTATLDQSAVIESIDRHVHALLDAASFGIYLMDDDGHGLTSTLLVEDGKPGPVDCIDLASATRIGARCVRERREIVVDFPPEAENPSHVPGTMHTLSALFAPLVVGERVLGMMTIQSPRRQAYGEREQQVFRTLGSYAAIALDNAAAYRRLADTDATLQRTLREQEGIFDNAAAAIFFVKGRFIHRCNRGMEEILGYGPGELAGQSTEIYHPSRESWERQGRALYPLITTGQVADGEWEIVRKDGARIWIAYRGRAIDPQDLSQGSIWIATDITERKRAEAALDRALLEQQLVFDNIAGSIVIAKDGIIHRCNRGFEQMLGFRSGEAIGQPASVGYVSQDAWKSFARRTTPDILAGRVVTGEGEYRHRDGTLRWMLYQGKAIDPNDIAQGTIWFGQDITERKHSETLLLETKDRLELGLAEVEQLNRQVTLLGELSGFLQACPSAEDAYACIGQFGPRLFPKSSGALYLAEEAGGAWVAHGSWGALTGAALDGAHGSGAGFQGNDCWALRRSRAYRVDDPAQTLCCPHVLAGPGARHPYVCVPLTAQGKTFGLLSVEHQDVVGSDEAERRHGLAVSMAEQIALAISNLQLREALLQQSIRDPLTGLFNRRHMQEALFREIGRSRRTEGTMALMMIDVDHFKRFNDTFGHAAGDVVLQQVARSIEAQVRRGDVACRFGGEEFAVLMPGATLDLAVKLANGVLDGVRLLQLSHDGRALDRITASLGVAVFPIHAHSPESLIESADTALYQAKDAGRNRVLASAAGQG